MASLLARSPSGFCGVGSCGASSIVESTLRFTRHRRLGFVGIVGILLGIILTIVLEIVAHLELHGWSGVNAGETRSAETIFVIGNGVAKIFDGKIAKRIGFKEAANFFDGLRRRIALGSVWR